MNYEQLKQKFVESLPKFLGHDNLLSQRDLDQGDTAQRVGTLYTLLGLLEDKELVASLPVSYKHDYDKLKTWVGIYKRSPDPSFWGHNPNNLSRDQLSVLKLGMLMSNDRLRLLSVFMMQTLRLGLHQNIHIGTDTTGIWYKDYKIPDLPSPSELAVYARGLLGYLSLPISLICDSLFIVDILLRKNSWDLDNMLAQNLLVAAHKYPSPVAKLLLKLYLKTDFMSKLKAYHYEGNGCEPLYWLYRMVFLKLEGYEE